MIIYDIRAWFLNLPDRVKWFFQRLFRGYDNPSWWNLNDSLAEWILPRLKHLRDYGHGHPAEMSAEKWDEILWDMIFAFHLIITMRGEDTSEQPWRDEIDKGLDLFRKWYFHLWD